ncbi:MULTISPECIES: metal-dependent transcriptional regulator [Rhodococcus]|uniref:metal-dependent transcriptional regulator n=2 Tax=Rhodococcus TaxID=1827 RepID=UPI0008960D47|nr:iron dependent repressor, metal binding and dimerization domain protein [Rhodococcus sp. LW-XY12]AYA27442.1 metal-dependent transcriptional regulator [Rhodococcus rhodochrous]SEB28839.1 Iron dependent repressor, metal binding and dimerisation domain [Rhodococcus pyridinivorans]
MPKTTGSPPLWRPWRVHHLEAVEDYLASLYRRSGRCEETSTTARAARLGWRLSAVSTMHRRQGAADLIVRPTAHRAELTGHGRQHARNVVRRNCPVKTFRAPELSLLWIELPREADRLEHVVGILFEVRLVRVLGYPRSNPFGSPIPFPTEDRAESWPDLLTAVLPCRRFTVRRIADHDSVALGLLTGVHIGLHTVLTDVVLDPVTDLVHFDTAGHRHIHPLGCAQ